MVDDAILSREAAYLYQYTTGFQPVKGNLTRWRGIVMDNSGRSAELEVYIPPNFPNDPPELTLPGTTEHPRVHNGKIITRSIQNWHYSNHVFQVIREAKSVVATGSFATIQQTNDNDVTNNLKSQATLLESQIASKKEELSKLKSQSSVQVQQSHDVGQLIEDSLIEVENESYALEEAYDNLEIKAIEFALNFVDARKRFYLIEAAKETR